MTTTEVLLKLPRFISESLSLVITCYTLISLTGALAWSASRRRSEAKTCPVSVLKPLHGDEPALYENLRSFCTQDYSDYQIVFGVHSEDDRALDTVRRLQREFPQLTLDCVIDPTLHGSNHKVSNLINIERATRHDWLVLADSDIRVGPDYLRRVTAPLAQPDTGIVTCLYRGRPTGGLWARLGALFINEWFTPTVLVAWLFGSRNFGFGATIALRRDALEAIGGLQAMTWHLADDYRLGELTRERGLQTVLSDYIVETSVIEATAGELVRHELRWLRTIRAIQPAGYTMMFMTFGLPLIMLMALLPSATSMTFCLLSVTAVARTVLHYWGLGRRRHQLLTTLLTLPLLPLRDALSLLVWAVSFTSRRVSWAGREFTVTEDGSFHDAAG